MSMPRVSIIVTSYNTEEYLEDCLASVVGQTLDEIEIIVVDDGSTDSSPQIIERLAAKDERIVPVLLGENSVGGVATAANTGLERATAPYVGFMDGDDLCEPAMFEELLAACVSQGTDLAMCKYKVLDDTTETLSEPADSRRWGQLDRAAYVLDVENQKRFLRFIAVPWRKLYRRAMLEENQIRFPVGDYFYEDNPFHWFSILSAASIAIVPKHLCYHRVDRDGQTMSTVDERLFRIFQHHDTIRDWLIARGAAETFLPTLLGWVISQMEWISARTPKELRRKLYLTLRPIFLQYESATVQQALDEGKKGRKARRLSEALLEDRFAEFNRYLDTGGDESGKLARSAYHLRHSGVMGTARAANRYLASRLRGRTQAQPAAEADRNVRNRDIMFALMVIDRRLAELEAKIDKLLE
jgi:glycosyltransferase involved in cell wall biosynthesis